MPHSTLYALILLVGESDLRRHVYTYDHVFRLCPHSLLVQGRPTSDVSLSQFILDTELEQCLIPRVLVCYPDGRWIYLGGNWSSVQLDSPAALPPTDTAEAIEAVFTPSVKDLPQIEGQASGGSSRFTISRPCPSLLSAPV